MQIKQTKFNDIQIRVFSKKIQFRRSITEGSSTTQAIAISEYGNLSHAIYRSYKPTHQAESGDSVQILTITHKNLVISAV